MVVQSSKASPEIAEIGTLHSLPDVASSTAAAILLVLTHGGSYRHPPHTVSGMLENARKSRISQLAR